MADIIKMDIEEYDIKVKTGFIWFRIGSNGGFL
jgi:hypothetical protein